VTAESGELPEGWATATLGDIADCRLGKMLDQAKNRGELRPYLRNTNVQWGDIGLDDIKEMRIEDDERERYSVCAGDRIVCEGGEPGRCAVWRDDREMYLQKALHRVRPFGGISAEYLRWWLQQAANCGGLEDLFTGSTIKHLPGRQLARVRVPVAPTTEQVRIARRLGEIEARRVRAITQLRRARVAVENFRPALLASVCDGQLTEPWRDTWRPEAIAAGIGPDTDSRHRSEQPHDAWRIPQEWDWTTPDQLRSPKRALTYGVIKLGPPAVEGVPTLRSSDVRWLRIEPSGVKRIAPDIADGYRRTTLEGGEVLVTVRGSLGGVAVVPETMRGWNVSREVAVIPLVADVDADYVALMIASPQCQAWLTGQARGVAYTGINIQDLKRMPLPLPPRPEQTEIVQRARRMLAVADGLLFKIDIALRATSRIAEAAAERAFRGELVPTEASLAEAEGRPYESAADVLARFAEAHPSKPARSRRAPVSA
jgi:type I restriction enzyme S subunit